MTTARIAAVAVLCAGVAMAQAQVAPKSADDPSVLSSPVPATPEGVTIPVGTVVSVSLTDHVDSGTSKNGDTVHGTLVQAVKDAKGHVVPAGSKVEATVVSAAPAGAMQSAGVLSLQLTRVAGIGLVSDVAEFAGKEGHREVADANPEKGTEAKIDPGTAVTFHVVANGPATGLDRSGADRARSEGTLNSNGMNKPAGQAQSKGSPAPAGTPDMGPRPGQTAAPGGTPH